MLQQERLLCNICGIPVNSREITFRLLYLWCLFGFGLFSWYVVPKEFFDLESLQHATGTVIYNNATWTQQMRTYYYGDAVYQVAETAYVCAVTIKFLDSTSRGNPGPFKASLATDILRRDASSCLAACDKTFHPRTNVSLWFEPTSCQPRRVLWSKPFPIAWFTAAFWGNRSVPR